MIELTGGPLYQWDTGRNVSLSQGPTSINALQFANQGDSQAVTVSIGDDDTVRIPDRYLMTGKPLVVYGVRINENSDVMETYGVKVFPVKGKAKPKDYVPTASEEAYGVVKKLSDEAKSAAEAAEAAKNSAQTYAQGAEDYAKDAFYSATNAKESADKAAETGKKLAPLIVDLNVANYDLPDILAALAAGRDVQLHVEDFENVPVGLYRLLGVASESALFATEEDGMLIVIHFHEGPQIDAYNYPLDLLDDKKEDSSYTWSSKKILEMIAQGGTGNVDMGDNRGFYCGFLGSPIITVAPSDTEGFIVKSDLVDGAFSKPVAVFGGSSDEESPVIIRNIADGTHALDAVNKGQMDAALSKKTEIDDTEVGGNAWSSKNIIDRLCPPINETGLLVQCEPVEGYPLEVQSDYDFGFVLTACGKNLYNKTAYPLTTDGYPYRSLGSFSTSGNYRRTDFIPVRHLAGQTITLNYAPVAASNPGMAFYKYIPDVKSSDDCKNAFCGGGSGYNTNVPAEAAYMCFSVAVGDKDKDIQIELGSEATEYEAYRGKTVTGEPGDVQIVPARKGQNILFAYSVSDNATAVPITVNGRADPVAIIKKLTQAVLSLGGNI